MLILILPLVILWASSGMVYYLVESKKDREKIYIRPLVALWAFWLEFAYIRIENGETTYKNSMRKIWSNASHIAFLGSIVIKLLYPLWATTGTVAMWQSVAASIDSVLILGLASHSVALATAYHFGKKQEIEQHEPPGEVGQR